MRLGIIGLGRMGSVFCQRLLAAGYSVRAFDRRHEAVEAAAAHGAYAASDVQDAARGVEVLLLSVPDDSVVREVLMGDRGAAAVMPPGTIVVDLSTCRPLVTRKTAEELSERDVVLVDAPVSGGVRRAVEGDLTVMVGGDPEPVERVRPILSVLGSRVIHVGGVGSGHAAKVINNLLSAATLSVTGEAVLLAAKAGLDPAVFIDVVNTSTGRSNSSLVKFPLFILPRTFDAGFSLGLMDKDVRIAAELARQLDVPLRVAEAVRQVWADSVAQGGADEDHTAHFKFQERWAGFSLAPKEPAAGGGQQQ